MVTKIRLNALKNENESALLSSNILMLLQSNSLFEYVGNGLEFWNFGNIIFLVLIGYAINFKKIGPKIKSWALMGLNAISTDKIDSIEFSR